MNNVPNIISTKDLLTLSDLFEWHFIACKKCDDYAQKIVNTEIKDKVSAMGKGHASYCQKIIKMLG